MKKGHLILVHGASGKGRSRLVDEEYLFVVDDLSKEFLDWQLQLTQPDVTKQDLAEKLIELRN